MAPDRLKIAGLGLVNCPDRGASDAGSELALQRVVSGAMVVTGEKARCIRRSAKVLRAVVLRARLSA